MISFGKEREERLNPLVDSKNGYNHQSLEETEIRSQELLYGLPQRWKGPQHSSHLVLLCGVHELEVGLEAQSTGFCLSLPNGITPLQVVA